MKNILFPFHSNDKGAEVKNLQQAITALFKKSALKSLDSLYAKSSFRQALEKEIREKVFGKATTQLITAFQEKQMNTSASGRIDEPTATALNNLLVKYKLISVKSVHYTVSGIVYDQWTEPMKKVRVQAFQNNMRSEVLIGEGKSNEKGNYKIQYKPDTLTGPNKATPDLFLRVLNGNGKTLHTTGIYYNASSQFTVDINLGSQTYKGPSLYATSLAKIKTYTGHLPLHDLAENSKEQDLTYLINKTGITINILLQLVASFRFEKKNAIPSAVYFGLLNQLKIFSNADGQGVSLPKDLDSTLENIYISLLSSSTSALIVAFQKATDNNIIPYELLKEKDKLQSELEKIKTNPPQVAEGTTIPTIYKKVSIAGLNASQQQVVIENLSGGNNNANLWTTISSDPAFKNAEGKAAIQKLQAVFTISDWTADNTALTGYIVDQQKINSTRDFSSLVSKNTSDWATIIRASGAFSDSAATTPAAIQTIASNITSGIERLYPTPVFADRFAKSTTLSIANRSYISGVLQAGDFDINKTAIPQYIKEFVQKNPLPQDANPQTIAYQLMGMQRVYKTVQNAETSLTLLSSNIQSARQIYAMGSSNFVSRFQESLGGRDNASAVFDQAANVHAGAAYLTGQLVSHLNNPPANVLPTHEDVTKTVFGSNYPDLANLFGTAASYCECKNCESFLGIPAYLTDILDFAYQRMTTGTSSKTNCRAVLLANNYLSNKRQWRRRPDLGDIDLDCDNTNIELPYIDVVNELLEDYIIPPIAAFKINIKEKDPTLAYKYFMLWINTYLASGKIDPALCDLILTLEADPKTPICNISLLTPNAIVSDVFFSDPENNPTWMSAAKTPQWIIRDQFITLKIALIIDYKSISLLTNEFGDELYTLTAPSSLKPVATAPFTVPLYTLADLSAQWQRDNDKIYFAMVVQEIHQTHLSAEEIITNPEYTNTNVYNSLSDPFNSNGYNKWNLYRDRIPFTLPFDLYFTEANIYLDKLGKKRYDLMNIYRTQTTNDSSSPVPLAGLTKSIKSIAQAYLDLSFGEAEVIFGANPADQAIFWGTNISSVTQPEVELFLTACGLDFVQLQTLLSLQFINPAGDSYIAENIVSSSPWVPLTAMDVCNTAAMVITAMTNVKYDRVNRFIRLWNKLNILTSMSMNELDACIMNAHIGNGTIDSVFAVSLYFFLQLMDQMTLSATQVLIFYQDIDLTGTNDLYQQLFQNRKISNPLVAAFHLPLPTGTAVTKITDATSNPGAVAVILTACQITQNDLSIIMALDNGTYTDLTIGNLSFIYACGLMSNALSCTVADIFTLSPLLGFNPLRQIIVSLPAAMPRNTFDFIAKYNALQNASLSVDDINYLLTNQSAEIPSLISDAMMVINSLTAIRTALQTATLAASPAPDPNGVLLKKWLADPDLNWDKNIAAALSTLLASINSGNYLTDILNNLRFLQLLQMQYSASVSTAYLDKLPSIVFPDNSIEGIQYDTANYYLFYYGTMSQAFSVFLSGLAPDVNSKTAVENLFLQSQSCPYSAILLSGASTTAPPAWVSQAQQNDPSFYGGTGALGFKGAMYCPVYLSILSQSNDAGYSAAVTQLFIASQGVASTTETFVRLSELPAISLPDSFVSGLSYNSGTKQISFNGVMSPADCRSLLGLSDDLNYQLAICNLFTSSVAGQTASFPLTTLPSGWTILPDISALPGIYFSPAATIPVPGPPALCFKGQMNNDIKNALLNLSTDSEWQKNLASLFTLSQSSVPAAANISGLPSTILSSSFPLYGVTYTPVSGSVPASLQYTGVMSSYTLDLLQSLSTDAIWNAAVISLYQNSQAGIVAGVLFNLPSTLTASSFTGIPNLVYTASGLDTILSFTGQMTATIKQTLLALSNNAVYTAAINYLSVQTSAIVPGTLPSIQIPLPGNSLSSTTYAPGAMVFTGTPNADSMDEFNLQQLNTDPAYADALAFIYSSATPSDVVGIWLASLPPVTLPSVIPVSWANGQISVTGPLQTNDFQILQSLSTDASYQSAISSFMVSLAALPSGVTAADLTTNGVSSFPVSGSAFVLSYPGVMGIAVLDSLIALSTDTNFQNAIHALYNHSQTVVIQSASLAALPPISIPSGLNINYDTLNHVLYYTGSLPVPAATITSLNNLSAATDYKVAVNSLAGITTNPGNYIVCAPAPSTAFAIAGITLSSGAIGYTGGTLSYTGPMIFEDYIALLALSADPQYQDTIDELYTNSKSGSSSTTIHSNNYLNLPQIEFPAIYENQLSFSSSTQTLTLRGYMEQSDRSGLLSLGNSDSYQQAIETLFQNTNGVHGKISFQKIVETLLPLINGISSQPQAADIYNYFLELISQVYLPLKQKNSLSAQIASVIGISTSVATVLVNDLPDLFNTFTVSDFAGNTKPVNPDPVQSIQALWFVKLTRIGFLINQYSISADDTDWLLKNAPSVGALDLTAYPGVSTPLTFNSWEIFDGLRRFQNRFHPLTISDPSDPGEDYSLSVCTIISAATAIQNEITALPYIPPNPGALIRKLVRLTGWNNSELLYLLNIDQTQGSDPLQLLGTGLPDIGALTRLSDITILLRLTDCFTIAAQLKVVPSRCAFWNREEISDAIATDIKQALKSLYPDDASWKTVIVPLMNTLRQNRRDAVLNYLIFNPVTNPFGYFDAFISEYNVYTNFLIDVEMAACQPTTRVIQAYCSVQLFIQRCLLNVEEPDISPDTDPFTGDPDWDQWDWMKTYESWYEARYTFLYPENLILPQTLPNASSLFQDMQNDLTQGAVTMDIVNTAFSNYIESLDGIARLDIKGSWYDDPTRTLYVFGRTPGGDPGVYYHRTLDSTGRWSPWNKVTSDITGDIIIPVVQNGRLYLYWPVFTQSTDDDKSNQSLPSNATSSFTAGAPSKYWKIQMAFSEYKSGKWSGKKVSKDYLTSSTLIIGPSEDIKTGLFIYPDASDFYFIVLDIPAESSDYYGSTIKSLEINNTMTLACYQTAPQTFNILIIINFSNTINSTNSSITLTLPVSDISTPTFSLQDVLDVINSTSFLTNGPYNPPINRYFSMSSFETILLNVGNPSIYLQGVINGLLKSDPAYGLRSVNVSSVVINYLFDKTSNHVSILKSDGNNCFLLDPARGNPTIADLTIVSPNFVNPIYSYWFVNDIMKNMLATGNLPLVTNKDNPILNSSSSLGVSSSVSTQMGVWSKYSFYDMGIIGSFYLGMLMPFYFQDNKNTFYVNQATTLNGSVIDYPKSVQAFIDTKGDPVQVNKWLLSAYSGANNNGPQFQFINLYHPFVHYYIKILAQLGLKKALERKLQMTGDPDLGTAATVLQNLIYTAGYAGFDFNSVYGPSSSVTNINNSSLPNGYPVEQMDFDLFSTYGSYNWEFFFHSVLMAGMLLSQNQQFEDADNFLKMIFDPTDTSTDPAPQKFWITKPFYKTGAVKMSLDEQILLYEADPAAQQYFWNSVKLWRNDPYDPHMLAQYRITPYMYTAFMKYLDNLIAWANNEYTQYTMESVNIAIQLYMLALEILGTKPEAIPPLIKEPVCNYYQVELNLESLIAIDGPDGYLSDPIVMVENLIPPIPTGPHTKPSTGKKLPMLKGLYFCVPPNEVLLGYWDTVEIQLDKIRNCKNIEGAFQPLSPFPSIPGMTNPDEFGVGDFGGVLPNYRFSVMIQKATELCNEVRSLGASLLSALEKKDAESLSLLHSTQEISVQKSIDLVRQLQITDAELSRQNLENYADLINDKIGYYSGLIQSGGLIPLEQQALVLNQFSLTMEEPITIASILASTLKMIPNLSFGMNGIGGSPSATVSIGGAEIGGAVDSYVQYMSFLSHFADKSAAIAVTNAGYTRRLAEWTFQLTIAKDELVQVQTQIEAAQNKIDQANQEEENQQLLIQNATDVDSFLRNKYTNDQLYSWLVTQVSNVYFKSYQLAYTTAKQSEICFRYELGITDSSYINYGYWDSLHKGLMSGEGLMSSIKQMEMDYMEMNTREYELTRNISLAQLDPVALLQLKSNGICFINIPEELFDLDYPGQYFRRIKHISVTLPGIVGPYTPVCLKLTLLGNSVRINNISNSPEAYPRHRDSSGANTNDNRFLDQVATEQYIATSNGVNDNGLFEMNFHDERYLPFERAGAISSWQVELPGVYPQFDRDTITDLILHISYTSRDGGAALTQIVRQSIQKKLATAMTLPGLVLTRAFSLRRDFPEQWYRFLNPPTATDSQEADLDITRRFPFYTQGLTIKISEATIFADVPEEAENAADLLSSIYISGPKLANTLIGFETDQKFGNMLLGSISCKDGPGVWKIINLIDKGATAIQRDTIDDLVIVFYYSLIKSDS